MTEQENNQDKGKVKPKEFLGIFYRACKAMRVCEALLEPVRMYKSMQVCVKTCEGV